MEINRLPNLKLYWENSRLDSVFSIKNNFICKQMTYLRYVFIRNHFRLTSHVNVNTDAANTVLLKTKGIINAINKMFSSVYIPNKNISIDESTIAFKGNCSTKVFNPSKPDKWGLQLKVLCDSKSHYVWKMKFWDGEKETLFNVMSYLLEKLENCNYHLFTDNLYNSYNNTIQLLKKGIYVTGTLRRKRGGPELMNLKKNSKCPKKSNNSIY